MLGQPPLVLRAFDLFRSEERDHSLGGIALLGTQESRRRREEGASSGLFVHGPRGLAPPLRLGRAAAQARRAAP